MQIRLTNLPAIFPRTVAIAVIGAQLIAIAPIAAQNVVTKFPPASLNPERVTSERVNNGAISERLYKECAATGRENACRELISDYSGWDQTPRWALAKAHAKLGKIKLARGDVEGALAEFERAQVVNYARNRRALVSSTRKRVESRNKNASTQKRKPSASTSQSVRTEYSATYIKQLISQAILQDRVYRTAKRKQPSSNALKSWQLAIYRQPFTPSPQQLANTKPEVSPPKVSLKTVLAPEPAEQPNTLVSWLSDDRDEHGRLPCLIKEAITTNANPEGLHLACQSPRLATAIVAVNTLAFEEEPSGEPRELVSPKLVVQKIRGRDTPLNVVVWDGGPDTTSCLLEQPDGTQERLHYGIRSVNATSKAGMFYLECEMTSGATHRQAVNAKYFAPPTPVVQLKPPKQLLSSEQSPAPAVTPVRAAEITNAEEHAPQAQAQPNVNIIDKAMTEPVINNHEKQDHHTLSAAVIDTVLEPLPSQRSTPQRQLETDTITATARPIIPHDKPRTAFIAMNDLYETSSQPRTTAQPLMPNTILPWLAFCLMASGFAMIMYGLRQTSGHRRRLRIASQFKSAMQPNRNTLATGWLSKIGFSSAPSADRFEPRLSDLDAIMPKGRPASRNVGTAAPTKSREHESTYATSSRALEPLHANADKPEHATHRPKAVPNVAVEESVSNDAILLDLTDLPAAVSTDEIAQTPASTMALMPITDTEHLTADDAADVLARALKLNHACVQSDRNIQLVEILDSLLQISRDDRMSALIDAQGLWAFREAASRQADVITQAKTPQRLAIISALFSQTYLAQAPQRLIDLIALTVVGGILQEFPALAAHRHNAQILFSLTRDKLNENALGQLLQIDWPTIHTIVSRFHIDKIETIEQLEDSIQDILVFSEQFEPAMNDFGDAVHAFATSVACLIPNESLPAGTPTSLTSAAETLNASPNSAKRIIVSLLNDQHHQPVYLKHLIHDVRERIFALSARNRKNIDLSIFSCTSVEPLLSLAITRQLPLPLAVGNLVIRDPQAGANRHTLSSKVEALGEAHGLTTHNVEIVDEHDANEHDKFSLLSEGVNDGPALKSALTILNAALQSSTCGSRKGKYRPTKPTNMLLKHALTVACHFDKPALSDAYELIAGTPTKRQLATAWVGAGEPMIRAFQEAYRSTSDEQRIQLGRALASLTTDPSFNGHFSLVPELSAKQHQSTADTSIALNRLTPATLAAITAGIAGLQAQKSRSQLVINVSDNIQNQNRSAQVIRALSKTATDRTIITSPAEIATSNLPNASMLVSAEIVNQLAGTPANSTVPGGASSSGSHSAYLLESGSTEWSKLTIL